MLFENVLYQKLLATVLLPLDDNSIKQQNMLALMKSCGYGGFPVFHSYLLMFGLGGKKNLSQSIYYMGKGNYFNL